MIAMKKCLLVLLLLLLLLGSFLAGTWHTHQDSAKKENLQQGRRILYYVDPMNPAHTSDKPGPAPCGMPMEPVYSDDERIAGDSVSAGTVKISAQKQQLIGVQVSPVERTAHTHTLRTIARVAPDETRVYRLNAGVQGFIREVSEVTTGGYVRKNQWLAAFSSPDSIAAIQAYIVALNAMDRLRQDNAERSAQALEAGSTFQQRVEKLQDLGISALQMEEIRRTREVPRRIEILSPADGFVLARNLSPDQKFERGAEWYRIADLSRVWVLADVFEGEAQYIRPGLSARVSLPRQGKVFEAQVSDIPPQFDATGRALKVRLELDNPGFVLRPEMFVDLEFLIAFPPTIAVPAEAVLDSGLRKTVFVALGDGFFEPRAVETGWRFGDRVEILQGLMPGDQIVVSGNFLIDSESRMKLAAAGLHGAPEKDLVCGMEVYPSKAKKEGWTSEWEGKTHYFCSPQCKAQFDEEHGIHGEKPAAGEALSASGPPKAQSMSGFWRDPVCGMLLHEKRTKAVGLKSAHGGQTYHFCSPMCKERFDNAPQRYLAGPSPTRPPLPAGDAMPALRESGDAPGRPPAPAAAQAGGAAGVEGQPSVPSHEGHRHD